MKIEVKYFPDTKVWKDAYKQYTRVYPDGYPVSVRRISHCESCGIEIGGYFGNKVYRHKNTKLCAPCGEKSDSLVQMAVAQTGLTPVAYQAKHGRAWNE